MGTPSFALFSHICTRECITKLQNLEQVKRPAMGRALSRRIPRFATTALKVQAVSFCLRLLDVGKSPSSSTGGVLVTLSEAAAAGVSPLQVQSCQLATVRCSPPLLPQVSCGVFLGDTPRAKSLKIVFFKLLGACIRRCILLFHQLSGTQFPIMK